MSHVTEQPSPFGHSVRYPASVMPDRCYILYNPDMFQVGLVPKAGPYLFLITFVKPRAEFPHMVRTYDFVTA